MPRPVSRTLRNRAAVSRAPAGGSAVASVFLCTGTPLSQAIPCCTRRLQITGCTRTCTACRPTTRRAPTLIRLPGYPLVLAALAVVFDWQGRWPLGSLQSFVPVHLPPGDRQTWSHACWWGSLAGRLFGRRAGLVALALAALCPFTANYTAVPLTETFTLLTIALALWAAELGGGSGLRCHCWCCVRRRSALAFCCGRSGAAGAGGGAPVCSQTPVAAGADLPRPHRSAVCAMDGSECGDISCLPAACAKVRQRSR